MDDNSVRELENHPLSTDDNDVAETDHVEETYIDEKGGGLVAFLGIQVVLVVGFRVSLVSLGRVPSSAVYRLSCWVLGCDHRSYVVVVQEIWTLTLTLTSLLNRPSMNPSLNNSRSLNCCNSNNSDSDSNNYFY